MPRAVLSEPGEECDQVPGLGVEPLCILDDQRPRAVDDGVDERRHRLLESGLTEVRVELSGFLSLRRG